MILDHTGHVERRTGYSATLPMRTLPRFLPGDLLHETQKLLEGTGVQAEIEPSLTSFDEAPSGLGGIWSRASRPPAVGLDVNGIIVSVTGYDRPAFSPDEIEALDTKHWEDARSVVSRSRTHVEVAEVHARISSDLDQNHDRALAVTLVSLAAARLVEASGIVWHSSLRCVPMTELPMLESDLRESVAPVELWIGVDFYAANGRHSAGVATRGLYPLLGAEIEVGQEGLPRDAAFDIALDLAERIVSEGKMPEHASRLDFGRGREFLVRHMPRGSETGAPTLALVPDSSSQTAGAA